MRIKLIIRIVLLVILFGALASNIYLLGDNESFDIGYLLGFVIMIALVLYFTKDRKK